MHRYGLRVVRKTLLKYSLQLLPVLVHCVQDSISLLFRSAFFFFSGIPFFPIIKISEGRVSFHIPVA